MGEILVFRHVPHEHLGLIAGVLEQRSFAYRYVDFYAAPDARPDMTGADALIVMGGPMNVDEVDRYPFLTAEVAAIRAMLDLGRPILGVCLGSQLIAKSLGAPVMKNPVPEIGWLPVRLTAAGRADPVLGHLAPEETVLEWHGDAFDLPAGVEWLATTAACRYQAFRYGTNVYGLLFHLEVDDRELDAWLADAGMRAEAEAAGSSPDSLREAAVGHRHRLAEVAPRVFGAFADLITAAPTAPAVESAPARPPRALPG